MKTILKEFIKNLFTSNSFSTLEEEATRTIKRSKDARARIMNERKVNSIMYRI